ncbi:hypothetical protein [Acetivibrio mesophilus]|uniref:hypothetical protein n=1 Tax=Acetivibrio mesophilus TaxID=2487273 RepID=UPI0012D8468A|nr:hypothetical protein [Acetivibrio mesophilus]
MTLRHLKKTPYHRNWKEFSSIKVSCQKLTTKLCPFAEIDQYDKSTFQNSNHLCKASVI